MVAISADATLLFIALIVFIAYLNILDQTDPLETNNGDTSESAYTELTRETNSSLPRMVDENTRLDFAEFTEARYHYKSTLVNALVEEINIGLFQFQSSVSLVCAQTVVTKRFRATNKIFTNSFVILKTASCLRLTLLGRFL